MILCQKRGCSREATQALLLGVGNFQDADDAPARCTVSLGVNICEECWQDSDPDGTPWLEANPSFKSLFAVSLSPDAPDLDRVRLLAVPMGSPEHQAIMQKVLEHRKN